MIQFYIQDVSSVAKYNNFFEVKKAEVAGYNLNRDISVEISCHFY